MKKFHFLPMFAVSCLCFSACQKKPIETVATNQEPEIELSVANSPAELDQMGMAAGIDEITYTSGSYNVTFHDELENYSVTILDFNVESIINMTISDGATSETVTIDAVAETMIVGGVTSSFSALQSYSVSEAGSVYENLAIIMSVHHALAPNSARSFIDNGPSDTFTPPNQTLRIFWGWQKNYVGDPAPLYPGGPCVHYYSRTFYILWIGVNHEGVNPGSGGTFDETEAPC